MKFKKCEHAYMEYIARGDEGLWGKECFCKLTDEECAGCANCKKYEPKKEEEK